MDESVASLSASLQESRCETEALRKELLQRDLDIKILQAQSKHTAEKEEELFQALSRLDSLHERNHQLERKIAELQAEIEDQRDELQEKENVIQRMEHELQASHSSMLDARERLDDLKASYEQRQLDMEEVHNTEVVELRAALEALTADLTSAERRARDAHDEADHALQRLDQAQQHLSDTERRIDELEHISEALAHSNEELTERIREFEQAATHEHAMDMHTWRTVTDPTEATSLLQEITDAGRETILTERATHKVSLLYRDLLLLKQSYTELRDAIPTLMCSVAREVEQELQNFNDAAASANESKKNLEQQWRAAQAQINKLEARVVEEADRSKALDFQRQTFYQKSEKLEHQRNEFIQAFAKQLALVMPVDSTTGQPGLNRRRNRKNACAVLLMASLCSALYFVWLAWTYPIPF